MNVKSKILKLSIILMLILVLIPAVAAEDSSESFYVEYAEESSDDVLVEESYSTDEDVEYAQQTTFISSENDVVEENHEDLSTHETHLEEPIEDNCDTNTVEPVECSSDVSQNVQSNEDTDYVCSDDFAEISNGDVIENGGYELIAEDISVINQGSLFISQHDYDADIILIKIVLNAEADCFETTSPNRGLTKIMELKNNILISQDVCTIFSDDFNFDCDSDIVGCTNKVTTDYVFSMDNSVVGDENGILIICNSCFLKFNPCFYAFISCDFLTFDGFFGGDCIIASELFCDFAVEHRQNDLIFRDFSNDFKFNPISGLSDKVYVN